MLYAMYRVLYTKAPVLEQIKLISKQMMLMHLPDSLSQMNAFLVHLHSVTTAQKLKS